jgi:hypothetical protein
MVSAEVSDNRVKTGFSSIGSQGIGQVEPMDGNATFTPLADETA